MTLISPSRVPPPRLPENEVCDWFSRYVENPPSHFSLQILDARFEQSDAAVQRCANERVCPQGPSPLAPQAAFCRLRFVISKLSARRSRSWSHGRRSSLGALAILLHPRILASSRTF